ncbi:MAG: rhamnulokinase [Candidatus Humimicrobiaceae bacterium]
MNKNLIAIDLGAGSSRVFLSSFNGFSLKTDEVYRFQNNSYFKKGTLFWDFKNLSSQLKTGLKEGYKKAEGIISSIGVDGWGCDFGCLDKNGILLDDPVSYRDTRTEGLDKEFFSIMPEYELFQLTSSKTYNYSTLLQLYHVFKYTPEKAAGIKKILPVASLVNYMLCGQKAVDPSIMSGTQFFDVKEKRFIGKVLEKAGIPDYILPDLKENGSFIGKASSDYFFTGLQQSLPDIALICCMDSCSAVTGIPLESDDNIVAGRSFFINSGTWSLIGVESRAPFISDDIFASDFTNWCSFRDKYIFIKTFNGFYYLQECRKALEKIEGRCLDYETLKKELNPQKAASSLLDINDDSLSKPGQDILEKIEIYFRNSSQSVPANRSTLLSAIFQSLVLEYFFAMQQLEAFTGRKFARLYMAGGGSMNSIFCQWISDCLGLEVFTGFAEAAVNGSITAQLVAMGEAGDLDDGREILRHSFLPFIYEPAKNNKIDWDSLKEKYLKLKKNK